MAKSLKPPAYEYLVALQDELETLYRDDDTQIREARADREMSRPALSEADQKYILVHVDPRDPAVADEAFREQASLSLDRPKLTVKSGQDSDKAEANSTLRENWSEQVLWTCGTREPGSDTMRDLTDAALSDGGGWSKLMWQRDVWEDRYAIKSPGSTAAYDLQAQYDSETEEAKKAAGPPFAWVQCDALSLYPVRSGGRLCEVLEVKEAPLRSTLRRYRLATDAQGDIVPEELGQETNQSQASSLVSSATILEHWDETYATWSVVGTNYTGRKTGRIVKQFKHRYPFGVPYDFAPGLWMSHWKNRKVGWGISETKRWLVRYRAYLRAMHAQYVARDLLSPLVRTVPQDAAPIVGADGKPRDREDGPQPGTILIGRPGETYQRIEYPDATTLEKHMVLVDQAIEKLESPRVTNLTGLEGAGFAISQVLSYEAVKIGPIANSLQELLKRQTLKLWALTRMIGERVYVEYDSDRSGYLAVGPEDLANTVRLSWEIQPRRATDDLIKARYAHERKAAGSWGEEEMIEFLGDNPDEIRRSKARDRIRETPAYKMWQDEVVFQDAGRGDLLAKAAEAEKVAMQGILPEQIAGAAQPGMPGAPPPGTAVPGQMGIAPDLGNLALAPNGRGAVAGAGPGAVVPNRSAAGGVQSLGN